jgi:hypothetical protein
MTQQSPQENIDLLAELDAGVFAQKLARAMADTALGVVITSKKGRVTVQLDIAPIGTSHQVSIAHKLSFAKPTGNGKVSEENTTETPVYVGAGGKLTILPDNQPDLYKSKREEAE